MNDLKSLATYLNFPVAKLSLDQKEKILVWKEKDGKTLRGLISIAKYLSRNSSHHKQFTGESIEERAAIDQWLEYRLNNIDRAHQEKDTNAFIKDINTYLEDKVYFVGHQLSLADFLLYYGLHNLIRDLTFYEKQKYMHLSRWFDNVQHAENVRQTQTLIPFQKNILYTGSAH
ncbi:AIMP3 [Mytilus edulis]|uniref:EEF1E1 n=1 Tax=Mytilus edulis TaxID=6550 RepID=A0A8S3U8V0_MYTED|nr:AIMP3 [Mytilus edulis]